MVTLYPDVITNNHDRWLSKLAKLPEKYIYEPWKTATQKAAGVLNGSDYPRPIVDHSVISKGWGSLSTNAVVYRILIGYMYRVTIQVVPNHPLASEQKLC